MTIRIYNKVKSIKVQTTTIITRIKTDRSMELPQFF